MASIGPKNPWKQPVDKRAQREAKIAALVRENHARSLRQQQRTAAAAGAATREEETKYAEPLPAVNGAGQSSGAAVAVTAAAPKSYAIEHAFPSTVRRPASAGVKAAGDVPRDRVRTKGSRHAPPPTVFPEPYPNGMCESLHRADFTGRKGAAAQATMSTSKLWKFVGPNSPPAALAAAEAANLANLAASQSQASLSNTAGSLNSTGRSVNASDAGGSQVAVNVNRGRRNASDDGSSGGNIFASRYENVNRPNTVAESKRYTFDGQLTASQAAYVQWKGHRPSARVVPATDRLVAAPFFPHSTQRDDFPQFADAAAAKSRGVYDPQMVWRYPKQGLGTETRDFKTDKNANFGPKPNSTRPPARPPQALRVPPQEAPFLFGSSIREEFPAHTVTGPGRRAAKGPAQRWSAPAPHSDGRDFLTDISAHYIDPKHMSDGAGLSKSIKF